MLHSRDEVAGGSEGDVDGDEMEDRMMLRKAEGEDRSWSDSNGDPSFHCKILTDLLTDYHFGNNSSFSASLFRIE